MYIVKLKGRANGGPTYVAGRYVKEYRRDWFGGSGYLVTTADPAQARRWPAADFAEIDLRTSSLMGYRAELHPAPGCAGPVVLVPGHPTTFAPYVAQKEAAA